jgi:hypothetical protein
LKNMMQTKCKQKRFVWKVTSCCCFDFVCKQIVYLGSVILAFWSSDSKCCHSEADDLPPRLRLTSKSPWKSFLLVLLFLAILPDFPEVFFIAHKFPWHKDPNKHDCETYVDFYVEIRRAELYLLWTAKKLKICKCSRKLSKTQKHNNPKTHEN